KNNGDQEITIPEFPRNYNGVEIVRPNGKRFLYREVTEFRLIVIKPSESKTWFMDATELLMLENAEGLYHIKWKINKVESKEVLLLKENSKKESRDL
ncbi:MAG: hypothetical protein JW787_08155, partial [Sedimentisphaerales bacterium]|nr:hypothetical protein [Sedimentisphaerales bacterium]